MARAEKVGKYNLQNILPSPVFVTIFLVTFFEDYYNQLVRTNWYHVEF